MAQHRTARRVQVRSPLPRYLGHTLLLLLANVAVLSASTVFDLDLLLPLILLFFALATLWLIPLFGYVVLLTDAAILFMLLGVLVEERTSWLRQGAIDRHYEVFSESDWVHLALAVIALGYLAWFAWSTVRGKRRSLLMRDAEDMGD